MIYFGFKQNIGYGFYSENFEGAIALSDIEWQNLLKEQSQNKDIVMFDGQVFASEPDIYYLDEFGHYKKRSNEEISKLRNDYGILQNNQNARNFLDETDWQVIRHRDQLALNKTTSYSEQEYNDLLERRQLARDMVINNDR